MLKTIIVTNKVKQIMYSTQTPPFTRELKQPPPFQHYIRQSAYLQDNQQNKKNAAKGLSFTAAVRIVALERILFDSWQFVCYKAFRALQ